jgi:hypothetical protein
VTAVASIAPTPIQDDVNGIEVDIPTPGPVAGSVSWTEGPEGWEGEGWLASSLGRVVVLGVVVLGALSGFGAVRTALNFYEQIQGGAGYVYLVEWRLMVDHFRILILFKRNGLCIGSDRIWWPRGKR